MALFMYSLLSTYYFNPRTHGECDSRSYLLGYMNNYFNPRTHGECDNELTSIYKLGDISIHALTGSATENDDESTDPVTVISIHALTGSATDEWL